MLDVTAFKILEKRFHFPVFNGTEGIECISSGRISTAERAVWIQVSLNNFPGLLNFRFLGGLFKNTSRTYMVRPLVHTIF